MLMRMQITDPGRHSKKTDLNSGVRVNKVPRDPRRHCRHPNAKLFLQLTHQGLGETFARFDLAARKLPVAGIGFTGRPLRQ